MSFMIFIIDFHRTCFSARQICNKICFLSKTLFYGNHKQNLQNYICGILHMSHIWATASHVNSFPSTYEPHINADTHGVPTICFLHMNHIWRSSYQKVLIILHIWTTYERMTFGAMFDVGVEKHTLRLSRFSNRCNGGSLLQCVANNIWAINRIQYMKVSGCV